MRTNKERQQLIYRRTRELRCKERRKKQCMFSVCGVALCLMLVIGIGSFMPGVVKQASVGNIDYTMGTASMLGHYEALGYICMGVLAFALGICVTVLFCIVCEGLRNISAERGNISTEWKQTDSLRRKNNKKNKKKNEKNEKENRDEF